MLKKALINQFALLFLVFFSFSAIAQSSIKERLADQKEALNQLTPVSVFQKENKNALTDVDAKSTLTDYQLLSIDKEVTSNLSKVKNEQLKLNIPFEDGTITLNLIKAEIFAPDFKITKASNPLEAVQYNFGAYYWGAIEGIENSMASISIFKKEMVGVISFNGANYNLGKLEGSDLHILYADNSLNSNPSVTCYADDDKYTNIKNEVKGAAKRMDESNCVGLYMETAFDMFQDLGSVTDVTDFVTAVFTEVAALYTNEAINIYINELVVWDVADPYAGGSPGAFLDQFMGELGGTFNGDLAHLLSFDVAGGVAYLDVICNSNLGYGFSGIFSSYNNVPAYSWTVEVITHELGHNLGSPHTHACAWNGDNTAIDGCGPEAGYSEGCDADLPDAGTIMSYCHLVSGVGIDFNLGFGTQPGDLIRDEVYNATCLTTCVDCETVGDACDDGDDCTTGDVINGLCECAGVYTDADNDGLCVGDDPDDMDPCVPVECPPCTEVTLTIVLDNYPEETTWSIEDASGTTVASGGAYGAEPDGSTVIEMDCLEEGCFDFIINDSYGDGICCGYGNGSYSLEDVNGTILASGGEFDFSETTNFCITVSEPCEEEGLPCDDGDVCTIGETYDVDCNCTGGVFTDADGDGFCIGEDPNDNDICDPEPNDPSCETLECDLEGEFFFDGGLENWVDGGSDCRRSVNDAAYANSGSYCVRLRDDSATSTFTSPDFTLASYNKVSVSFTFIALSMEATEGFVLEMSTDGGGSFSQVADWYVGTDFTNDVRVFESITIDGPLSDETQIRFKGDAANNSDFVYIDDVIIEGCDYNGACSEEDFNTFDANWGLWNDGGSDCRRSPQDVAYAASGTRCVRLRDDSSTSNMTSDNFDATMFGSAEINFTFITDGLDAGEGLALEYSTDGGATFSVAEDWYLTDDFENNVRQFVTQAIFGPFSTTTQFRVSCLGSDNLDYVYIDDMSITFCGELNIQTESTIESRDKINSLSFDIYPNPIHATNEVRVNIQSTIDEVQLTVVDMFGNKLSSDNIIVDQYDNYRLSTENYPVGTYLIRVESKDTYQLKKLIVIK